MLEFFFSPNSAEKSAKSMERIAEIIEDRLDYINKGIRNHLSDPELKHPKLADQKMTAANQEVLLLLGKKLEVVIQDHQQITSGLGETCSDIRQFSEHIEDQEQSTIEKIKQFFTN